MSRLAAGVAARVAVGAAVVLAPSLAGCAVSGLSFVTDDRVDLLLPEDRSTVTLPLTIAWEAEDVTLGEGAGSFGVVIDRTPPPPGETLAWLFRGDDVCGDDGCPDPTYRAQRGVHQTTQTGLVLDEVVTQGQRSDDELHEATVFLLDADGRRQGEGSWSVQFRVDRPEGVG